MGTRYGPVKLKVPKGFPMLLQKFAKEVLREQPTDIAKFGETYFQGLLDHRNATGEDPLKGDDEPGLISAPKKILRPINSEIRQHEIRREIAVTKIQAGYRGYRVRKQSRQERDQKMRRKQDAAATKIQARYRGYRQRKSLSAPAVPKNEEETEPQKEDQQPKNADEERKAAIRIQSNFRGYRTRKSLKEIKTEDKQMDAAEALPTAEVEESHKREVAVVKIQASYRGYRTRQQLKKTRDAYREEEISEPKPDDAEEDQTVEEKPQTDADQENDPETDRVQENSAEEKKDDADVTPETVEEEGQQEDHETAKREMEAAALKIQASFRGHQTRKQLKKEKEDSPEVEPAVQEDGSGDAPTTENKADSMEESEVQDAPADQPAGDGDVVAEKQDEEKEAAAVKIQAKYRGYRTRKQMKTRKEAVNQPTPTEDVEQEEAQDGEPQD